MCIPVELLMNLAHSTHYYTIMQLETLIYTQIIIIECLIIILLYIKLDYRILKIIATTKQHCSFIQE